MRGEILDIVGVACVACCLVWGGYVIASSDPAAPMTARQVIGLSAWFAGIAGLICLIVFRLGRR